jgi:hypothetical protein
MNDLAQCAEEQARCAEYLLTVDRDHPGARMGLFDWMAEEVLIRNDADSRVQGIPE